MRDSHNTDNVGNNNAENSLFEAFTVQNLYTLSATRAAAYLAAFRYPWEALGELADWIRALQFRLPGTTYRQIAPEVYVGVDTEVASTATLIGPCIIGQGCEVRPGAYVRGAVLAGDGCVIGNSTELKNCILFDSVQVPHYNYVGDSILGKGAHMGAGAVTSNVKGDKTSVSIHFAKERILTGRKKCGAFLGDGAEIGCGCVLNPGTVIGKGSRVYPLVSVRECVPSFHIVKNNGCVVKTER